MARGAQWWLIMAHSPDRHPDKEAIEKYSLGAWSARRRAEIEEHLLLCDPCRQAVTASDAYVAAMTKAAAKVRQGEGKTKRRVAGNKA
jgi:anti-sigma factor ChrR (cupin superfamily)